MHIQMYIHMNMSLCNWIILIETTDLLELHPPPLLSMWSICRDFLHVQHTSNQSLHPAHVLEVVTLYYETSYWGSEKNISW